MDDAAQLPARKRSRWLRLVIYATCAVAFAADLVHDTTLAFGVFYIPLVCTAVYHRSRLAPWWLAAVASAMVAIGFFTPHINAAFVTALADRLLSVAAILITAYLLHHERQVGEALVAQTARADAADRFRSRLFNNLSHELRTPLAAILGFADLLLPKARDDQRAAIGHIRAGGRRLLATVDNLIDLTQIGDRPLRARQIDVVAVLTHAVSTSQPLAAERQVTLTMAAAPDAGLPYAMADGWALRRIVDNLIANGIKFTEPGGSVTVTAHTAPGGIAVAVRDTGPGMPPQVLRHLGEPFFQADSGTARRFEGMGAGLALSLRLADAMDAALHFDSAPDKGTTATLILPAMPRDNSAGSARPG